MTVHDKVIAHVQPVYLINVEQHRVHANPQINPTTCNFGCDSAFRLL